MTKHIFNVKALAEKLTQTKESAGTLYHRINTIMKGAEFAATPELLDELESIIKKESDNTLKSLRDLRKKLTKDKRAAA